MFKIGLLIHESYLLEALQELLPQAGFCVKENEADWDCLLYTPPYTDNFSPSLDLSSLLKPLSFFDLLAAIKGLPYNQDITFAHFSLDLRERILTNLHTQESQRLTEKECQLLRFFHQHRGVLFLKEALLQELWGYHPDVETHTLETHIYRLRQKLEKDPNNPEIILNSKDGYFLR